MTAVNSPERDAEDHVHERYARAATAVEPALCCAVQYSSDLLQAIPDEILRRDYGCGDPSPFVRLGDVVLDLGAGGGKLCYIAAQLTGPTGRVIGVDCNREMLQLARRYQDAVAQRLGFRNVEFRFGRIQDLRLDLEQAASELHGRTVESPDDLLELLRIANRLRDTCPMIPDGSVDCVLSNCVLNLVRPADRTELFRELYRVVRPGGRVAISDIVSNQDVPESMRQDGQLWSGCISGAWREDRFLDEFTRVGFQAVQVAQRQEQPWQTVDGIEFRSLTVLAHKTVLAGNVEQGADVGKQPVVNGDPCQTPDAKIRQAPQQLPGAPTVCCSDQGNCQ